VRDFSFKFPPTPPIRFALSTFARSKAAMRNAYDPPPDPNESPAKGHRMKAENLLAELNRLRKDIDEDKSDIEWLTLHHVFCFVSYKIGEFQKYVEQQDAEGAFDEYDG
jgi:hypothetical protein